MITGKFKEKDVALKDAAAEYALSRVPERFRRILKEAQNLRLGLKSRYRSPLGRRRDMIDYIEYVIGECRKAI